MQTIQFGYSQKVNRPGRRTISPFPRNTYDITRIRNGNPYLDPEYSDVAELKYSSNSRKLNFNADYHINLLKIISCGGTEIWLNFREMSMKFNSR